MKFLERMRNKTNSEKRQVAFAAAVLITLFIFIIWVVNVFYNFDISKSVTETKTAISPIKSLISSFKSILN